MIYVLRINLFSVSVTLSSLCHTSVTHNCVMEPRDVVIVGAARTPLGAFNGSLSSLPAPVLGAEAIKAAISRANLDPSRVDEVLMGNVCSANIGQAPATQAMLAAGIPQSVPATTINKVCSSGMKAAMLGALTIQQGLNEIVVAGGMESMSRIPHYLPGARAGLRIGHGEVVDGMIIDGLWDPYSNMHMGSCAELCAQRYGFTREMQDAHATSSHERARKATAAGWAAQEIVPIKVNGQVVDTDEGPAKFNADKLRKLRPVFKPPEGASATVTAGNASPVTDGAAALVLASYEAATSMGLPIQAVIRSQADANQAPEWFTTTPSLAVPKAVSRAGLGIDDINVFEFNEAFSVVDLANRQLLQLSEDRVNLHGGAVALGHPIGASGARILVTLLNVLQTHGKKVGCAAICNGGGGASAMVVERWNAQRSAL